MELTERYGYIEIDKTLIPYRFDITLAGEVYFFDVRYAEETGIITLDVFDSEEEPIVFGEPLVYAQPLFEDVEEERLPLNQLVPFDLSGIETAVTFDNLGNTVFVYDVSEPIDDNEGTEGEDE